MRSRTDLADPIYEELRNSRRNRKFDRGRYLGPEPVYANTVSVSSLYDGYMNEGFVDDEGSVQDQGIKTISGVIDQ